MYIEGKFLFACSFETILQFQNFSVIFISYICIFVDECYIIVKKYSKGNDNES